MIVALASPGVASTLDESLDLVQEIKVDAATGLLAARYAPERYQEVRRPESQTKEKTNAS